MKSTWLVCTSLATTAAQEDDSGALLQLRGELKGRIGFHAKAEDTDCTGQALWMWEGGSTEYQSPFPADSTTVDAEDPNNPCSNEVLANGKWKVLDAEAWAFSAPLVQYAITGGKTCSEYCQGKDMVCVRGMDDAHHQRIRLEKPCEEGGAHSRCSVWPGGHSRQSQQNSGCDQKWYSQICACAHPVEENIVTGTFPELQPELGANEEDQCDQEFDSEEEWQQSGVPDFPPMHLETSLPCRPQDAEGSARHVPMQFDMTAITPHISNDADKNGKNGPFFQINMKAGTATRFHLQFAADNFEQEQKLVNEVFHMRILDFDRSVKVGEFVGVCEEEGVDIQFGQDIEEVTDDQEKRDYLDMVGASAESSVCRLFRAVDKGFGCDNPTALEGLPDLGSTKVDADLAKKFTNTTPCGSWNGKKGISDTTTVSQATMSSHPLQLDRELNFTFTDKLDGIDLIFGAPSTKKSKGGRNFFYQVLAGNQLSCDHSMVPEPAEPELVVPPLASLEGSPIALQQWANTKCHFPGKKIQNSDERLFRLPEDKSSSSLVLEECKQQCFNTEDCAYYSFGEWPHNTGKYVCMGCRDVQQRMPHPGFTLYELGS